MQKQRIIAHLDLDAFFASVEERETPWMAGKPIVVGSDPMEGGGRGVVSTANYAARAYGIRSALPISRAWQFSQDALKKGLPEAIFVTPDFRKYSKASQAVMEIIRKYSEVTEQASIDEMYFDLSRVVSETLQRSKDCSDSDTTDGFLKPGFRKAEEICRQIKQEIKAQERITASIGLGPNKLVAKIASDMQKPDGLTVVLPEKAEEFLEALSIRKIPGIGPKTEENLNKLGAYKIQDLKKYSQAEMGAMLGKWGAALYFKIRGIDDSPVFEGGEIKSIGEQVTFQEDTLEFSEVVANLEELCAGVFRRFQKSDFRSFRTVVITVRFADFNTKTRSHTLLKYAKTLKVLKVEALKRLMPFFDGRENSKRQQIRLIGVRIEKLSAIAHNKRLPSS